MSLEPTKREASSVEDIPVNNQIIFFCLHPAHVMGWAGVTDDGCRTPLVIIREVVKSIALFMSRCCRMKGSHGSMGKSGSMDIALRKVGHPLILQRRLKSGASKILLKFGTGKIGHRSLQIWIPWTSPCCPFIKPK